MASAVFPWYSYIFLFKKQWLFLNCLIEIFFVLNKIIIYAVCHMYFSFCF